MNGCCALAIDPHKDGRVIYQTPNFFVSAALGSMGRHGYLLVVSNEHLMGTGDLPEDLHEELDETIKKTRRIVEKKFGPTVMFEHGPRVGRCGWGGCIDHLHLHLVPVDISNAFAIDLMDRLDDEEKFYRVDRRNGFERAVEIYEKGKTSYLLFEPPDGRRMVTEVNFPGESQWLRKLVAREIGTGEWNWRLYPHHKTALETVAMLKGEF